MPDDQPADKPTMRAAADQAAASLNGKGGKVPPLPDHSADAHEMRAWLAAALPLPVTHVITTVEQSGPRPEDTIKIGLRSHDGTAIQHTAVRFKPLANIASPAKLRTAFAAATGGAVRVRAKMTGPQAIDVLTVLASLATMLDHATDADVTRTWLREYLEGGDQLVGLSLATPEDRYAALKALAGRVTFTGQRARLWLRAELPDGERWSILIDQGGRWWIRVSEFAAYVRHVVSPGPITATELDLRMHEVGGERLRVEADMRHEATLGDRPRRTLYRVPDDVLPRWRRATPIAPASA